MLMILCLIIPLILNGSKTCSQYGIGTIKVYVEQDGDKLPLTDWMITIISSSNSKTEKIRWLSEYKINNLPVDIYTVRIKKKGYHSKEFTNLQIKDQYITVVSFKLKKRKVGEKKQIQSEEFKTLKVDPNINPEQ